MKHPVVEKILDEYGRNARVLCTRVWTLVLTRQRCMQAIERHWGMVGRI
jgi:hypothetical protein